MELANQRRPPLLFIQLPPPAEEQQQDLAQTFLIKMQRRSSAFGKNSFERLREEKTDKLISLPLWLIIQKSFCCCWEAFISVNSQQRGGGHKYGRMQKVHEQERNWNLLKLVPDICLQRLHGCFFGSASSLRYPSDRFLLNVRFGRGGEGESTVVCLQKNIPIFCISQANNFTTLHK